MHSDQIKYLIEVSNTGSINSAAKNLFITPSALSMSLQKLEKEFGLALLTRTQKGVTLTEAGKRFVEISLNYFRELNKLIKAEDSDFNVSGDIGLIMNYGVLDYLISPFICAFYQAFPQIHLTCREYGIDDVCLYLGDAANDLALIVNHAASNALLFAKCQLEYHALAPCQLVIRADAAHPLAAYRVVTFKQLEKYPLIIFHPPACSVENNPLYRLLDYSGFASHQLIFESNQALIAEMVHANLGVSLTHVTPFSNPGLLSEYITQIPLKSDLSLSFGYLLRQNTTLSLAATIFLNELITDIAHKNMHSNIF